MTVIVRSAFASVKTNRAVAAPDATHLDPHAERRERSLGAVAVLVVAQSGEEQAPAGEPGELDRRDAPPPPGSSHDSRACTISPGAGTRSTWANSIHSTCPTTATFTAPSVLAGGGAGAAVGSSRSSPPSSSPGDEPGRRYHRSTMMPPMPASIVRVFTQLVRSTWNVCAWKKSGTYMEWRNRTSIMTRAKNANPYRDTRHRQRNASTGNTHAANHGRCTRIQHVGEQRPDHDEDRRRLLQPTRHEDRGHGEDDDE